MLVMGGLVLPLQQKMKLSSVRKPAKMEKELDNTPTLMRMEKPSLLNTLLVKKVSESSKDPIFHLVDRTLLPL